MPDHVLTRARAKRARASSNPTKNQNSARRSIDVVRDLGGAKGGAADCCAWAEAVTALAMIAVVMHAK
jgi:hypothetical protein